MRALPSIFMGFHRGVVRRTTLRGVLALLSICLSTTAFGQEYKTLPVEEGAMNWMSFSNAAKNPAGFGASQADAEKFLKSDYLAKMTRYTPEALTELGKLRQQLSKLLPAVTNGGTRDSINGIILTYGRGMARNNFHPAVRYNAVLMLGELDQQPATATASGVPLPAATAELLEHVEQDQFNKIPVPESVKLGALIGLNRHSKAGISPELKGRTTKAMIKVIASEAPEDVEKNVHDWVRSMAAQVLANQYRENPTKEVQTAITALIADKNAELDDRCTAAGVLNNIKYPANADIDGGATTDALGQLAFDVMTDAAKLARVYQKEAIAGADFSALGGGGRGGGRGGFGGEDENRGPQFEKRQLYSRLYSIGIGTNSLKAGVADADKGRLDDLLTQLTPVMQAMEAKNASPVLITNKVIELETTLKSLLESWVKPAAAAAAVDQPAEAVANN